MTKPIIISTKTPARQLGEAFERRFNVEADAELHPDLRTALITVADFMASHKEPITIMKSDNEYQILRVELRDMEGVKWHPVDKIVSEKEGNHTAWVNNGNGEPRDQKQGEAQ